MADVAARLDRVLKLAGVPISGVSIGKLSDRSTWIVCFLPEATPAHRATGETIRATFDPDGATAVDAEKDEIAKNIDDNLLIQAVAMLDFEERQKLQVKAGQTLLTAAQCKTRAKAIYRSLLP